MSDSIPSCLVTGFGFSNHVAQAVWTQRLCGWHWMPCVRQSTLPAGPASGRQPTRPVISSLASSNRLVTPADSVHVQMSRCHCWGNLSCQTVQSTIPAWMGVWAYVCFDTRQVTHKQTNEHQHHHQATCVCFSCTMSSQKGQTSVCICCSMSPAKIK